VEVRQKLAAAFPRLLLGWASVSIGTTPRLENFAAFALSTFNPRSILLTHLIDNLDSRAILLHSRL